MNAKRDDEDWLAEFMDRWEDLAVDGADVDWIALMIQRPDLLTELKNRVRKIQSFDRWGANAKQSNSVDDSDKVGLPTLLTHPDLQFESRYNDLIHHASGTNSDVYVAKDAALFRQVAVKILKSDRSESPGDCEKFRTEAEVIAHMAHPSIIPIYGTGESNGGRPFYAMRFIEGPTLLEQLDEMHRNRSTQSSDWTIEVLRSLVKHFIQSCRAIGYAHTRGIIHRDIKPAHILVGKYGETWVIDWGLAKPFHRQDPHKIPEEDSIKPHDYRSTTAQGTNQQSAVGTPAFMSPEHMWNGEPLTPAADIYSLGVSLYLLLTGRLPFVEDDFLKLRQRILAGNYLPPSQVFPELNPRFDAIIERAMNTSREKRYSSAFLLADDLESLIEDQTSLLRSQSPRPQPWSSLGRWWRLRKSI